MSVVENPKHQLNEARSVILKTDKFIDARFAEASPPACKPLRHGPIRHTRKETSLIDDGQSLDAGCDASRQLVHIDPR